MLNFRNIPLIAPIMKKNLLVVFLASFLAFTSQAQTTLTLDSTVLNYETVIGGIDIPWEITWGPDNWIWMTERFGRVSRVNPDNGQQDVILDISGTVYQASESGLLGLEFHPQWPDSNYVFIAYTYGDFFNITERMERYEYNGTSLVNPMTIVDGIAGNTTHDGCRILALSDGTLILTTGDAQNTPFSQNLNSLNGKVLRYNPDGSIPADNPIAGSPVFSWGHRNAQGLWEHNGIIYCSEHGPSNDDEFHILEKGRNYGWPNVEGMCNLSSEIAFCNDSNVVEPLVVWTPTIAPSDIIWYDHPSIPEWQNSILMTVLKDKELIKLELNGSGDQVMSQTAYLSNQFNRLRDICVSPTGAVYIATNGSSWSNNNPNSHSIIKIWNDNFSQVGVGEYDFSKEALTLMPNPAEGDVSLRFTPGLVGAQVSVIDVTGKQVAAFQVSAETMPFERGELAAGTYYVKVQSEYGQITESLVLR